MKSAIALLSVLALTVYVAAAMNVPWRPLPTAERQRMSYGHGHEPNRRMDNKPGNEQSIQGYGPGEQNTERKIDYPAAQTIPVAIQQDVTKSLYVDSLTSGAVQLVYRSPDGGSVTVNLFDSANDVLVVINMSFFWSQLMLLSITAQGTLHQEIYPLSTYIPCCGSEITLRIGISETGFLISANGIEISQLETGLASPVAEVEYIFVDYGTPMKAELLSMSVDY